MTTLRGIRGAISVAEDTEEAILSATAELLRTIMDRNGIEPEDVVSAIFTATPDLRAAFPAAAARSVGMDRVPVLSGAELDVEGALPGVVRVLLHAWVSGDEVVHVYLGEAASLREDLA